MLERDWDTPLHHYWIDLRRCTTSAEVLDAIVHASRTSWADDAILAGLVRAFDDLLDPMANLCSGGESRTMSSHGLNALLARGGAR